MKIVFTPLFVLALNARLREVRNVCERSVYHVSRQPIRRLHLHDELGITNRKKIYGFMFSRQKQYIVHNIFATIMYFKSFSIHMRSSWYVIFLCNVFKIMSDWSGRPLLWDSKCLYTVCWSIFNCSLIREPIVLPDSPTYTIPQCEHVIS